MEESDEKNTCGWTRLKFKIEKLRKKFNSKSDTLYFFQFKIWHVMKISIQYHAFKKHEKCEIGRLDGVKWNKTRFFECKQFFKIWYVEKIFNSKSNALHFFQSKIWRFVKFSNQNLTRCIFFQVKIWHVVIFTNFKLWHVVNCFFSKLFFQSVAEL